MIDMANVSIKFGSFSNLPSSVQCIFDAIASYYSGEMTFWKLQFKLLNFKLRRNTVVDPLAVILYFIRARIINPLSALYQSNDGSNRKQTFISVHFEWKMP